MHTCIYIHIYMSAHIYTYTYIHTHIQNVHMHARKHAWNDGAAATAREASLDTKELSASPPRENSNPEGGHPPQRAAQLTHSRRMTGMRRTTTPDSSSSHHHDSALSRPHSLICTGAEPIHQVHGPPKLPAWLWPPETRSFVCHFGAFFESPLGVRCTQVVPRITVIFVSSICSRYLMQNTGNGFRGCVSPSPYASLQFVEDNFFHYHKASH
jgi:hypothetical protein